MTKLALLIGMSEYEPGLAPLPSAVRDVDAMQRVLQHPEMGGFDEIQVLKNPAPLAMQEAIETLFTERPKDDLVLMFFSGHGIKDDNGRLYFATRQTRKTPRGELVKATAVPASFVQDMMSHSRCKRQVAILDCCFSGAFAEGMTAKDDGTIDIKSNLGGEGRVILTSSTSTQYSFAETDSDLSIYTRYLIEGIETGAADTDGDGAIAIDELHDYARRKVQEAAPAMKPKIFAVEEGFRILLASAPTGDPKLEYRREVERLARRGEISYVGRQTLDVLRIALKLDQGEAVEIETEVLNPYREYQNKLQRYEQVLAGAMQQENPLSPHTYEELQRFQRILGLRDEDVAPIQAKLVAVVPAAASEPELTIPSKPSLTDSQPQFLPQSVTSVAASTLPWKWLGVGTAGLGIVMLGALLLPHQSPQVSSSHEPGATASSPSPQLSQPTAHNSPPSTPRRSALYAALEAELAAKRWKKADNETFWILLKSSDKGPSSELDETALKNLSCDTLSAVDQLWTKYSDGRFGLSVQKTAFLKTGNEPGEFLESNWQKFTKQLGWNSSKEELLPTAGNGLRPGMAPMEAPKGYLPSTEAIIHPKVSKNYRWRKGVGLVYGRLSECKL